MKVYNTSGRVIFNTDDPFVGETVGPSQFVNSAGTAWPPSGLGVNELPVFTTKTGVNGVLSLFHGDYGISVPIFNTTTYGAPSGGFRWHALTPQNEVAGGGYGLKCYNSVGQVGFDTGRISRGLDIVAAGVMTSLTATLNFEVGRDPEKYVVDLSNSSISTLPSWSGGTQYTTVFERSYCFDKTNGRIILRNWSWNTLNPGAYSQVGVPFRYLIGYIRD